MICYDEGDWNAPNATRSETDISHCLAFIIENEVIFTCKVDPWLKELFTTATKYEEHFVDEEIMMYQLNVYSGDELRETLIVNEMMFAMLQTEHKIVEYDIFPAIRPGFKYLDGKFYYMDQEINV